MKNFNIKNLSPLFLLLTLLFLVFLFSIWSLKTIKEINSLYFHTITNQSIIIKRENFSTKPITLIFVGDIMLDRGVEYMIRKHGKGDYKFPFLKIANYLNEADILFGNLEGPLSDKGKKVGSVYSFRMKPEAIRGLKFAGFDILSVANNHIFDYGRVAMEDTFLRLKEAGIDFIGGGFNEIEAYSPIIKEVKGTKIAFLAYTNLCSPYWEATNKRAGIACPLEAQKNSSSVFKFNKERMEESIKKAKDQADLVVVSFHYGDEYKPEPNSFQVFISQTAINAGADLVIGHHPHVVQKIEKYKKGYIAYSLGNFVFDQKFSEKTMRGLLLKVILEDNKIKELIPVEIKVNEYFQPEIIKK